jgi:hypothetical protein
MHANGAVARKGDSIMHESEKEHELAAWEARLGAFRPTASRLDRDRVMFLAGRASVECERSHVARPAGWAWPVALASMTAIAGSLLVALIMQQLGDTSPPVPGSPGSVARETPHASVQDRGEAPGDRDNREVPAAQPQRVFWPRTETLIARSQWTDDDDGMLAQSANSRGFEQAWESECPPGSFGPPLGSAPSRRPRSYVEHRRMLLEELNCVRETSAEESFGDQPTGV